MGPWLIGWCLGLMFIAVIDAQADERWRGNERGKCEARCERVGRAYRCKEYRC